jgi:hypothetical protein
LMVSMIKMNWLVLSDDVGASIWTYRHHLN